MTAYCVRVIETNELVGIYAAPSPTNLAELIDEGFDPNLCEYQPLPEGGLYWSDKTTQTSPMPDAKPGEEGEEGEDPTPAGAEFTEAWTYAIAGGEGPWRPVTISPRDEDEAWAEKREAEYAANQRFRVTFDVVAPVPATYQEVEFWLHYRLVKDLSMKDDEQPNPLARYRLRDIVDTKNGTVEIEPIASDEVA